MSSRPRRPVFLSSVMLLLAACGGGGGSAPADGSRATYAELQGWLDLATNRVALTWFDEVQDATRFEIEQQDSNGAWVVIDAVWAVHGQAAGTFPQGGPQWQGIINAPATLRVAAVTPGSRVLLGTTTSDASGAVETTLTFAPPASLPSIELDQSEPLESSTQVTLGNASKLSGGSLSVDSFPSIGLFATPTLTLNPAYLTSGTHVIYALFAVTQSTAASLLISRSVQTHNSALALASVDFVQNADLLDDYLVATSDAGIASMEASVDDTTVETVAAPNACVPQPCVAGQAFNGYHLSANTQSVPPGSHTFGATVTDNAGHTNAYRANFSLPAPAIGALDSPADGAVVSGTFHVSGTLSAGAPGPLEVTVTLNGNPVYSTTVANTGVTTPFSGTVSLSGVATGYHNLHVYVRVGNTIYTEAANIVLQVVAAP